MRRRKEIPARIFHILWDAAIKSSDRQSYMLKYATISTDGMRLARYNLNDHDTFIAVSRIYDLSHRTVKEIAQEVNLKKSDMGHLFCIPKRTLEEWYKNDSRCPAYIKLSMIKQLGLFDIGKDIHIEGFGLRIINNSVNKSNSRKNSSIHTDENKLSKINERDRRDVAMSIEVRMLLEKTSHIGEQLKKRKEG